MHLLLQEQQELPNKIGAAARKGELASARSLKHRQREVEVEIIQCRIAEKEQQIEDLRGRERMASAVSPEAMDRAKETERRLQDAQAAHDIALREVNSLSAQIGNFQDQVNRLNWDLGQLRDQLAKATIAAVTE